MKLSNLTKIVIDKSNLLDVNSYLEFASGALEYLEENNQALIVSQNENNYCFFQFNEDADYNITRPFNSDLLYTSKEFARFQTVFTDELELLKENQGTFDSDNREVINRIIYTSQQCVGFILDGLTQKDAKQRARKLNGDLFENFILKILNSAGVKCRNGNVRVPIIYNNEELTKMNYQHDLIIDDEQTSTIKMIGSIKTTSKDRIDKVFIDKYMFSKLTDTSVPHIAIFLHDVQRKKNKDPTKYGINSTFLSGRFKGYTVKLNPLDGVYYFDLRPNMVNDTFFKDRINKFDSLIYTDIWKYV